MFGFPGKLKCNGQYQLISGFVSCFHCLKTLTYDGSTKNMNKHKCLNSYSPINVEKNYNQRAMDKYLVKNTNISNNDKEKLKEKIVSWACLSIRSWWKRAKRKPAKRKIAKRKPAKIIE